MRYKEVDIYENDVSAEEETEIQSAWIQSKDEDSRRKKSACKQKSKRKKSIISVGRIYVAFSSIYKDTRLFRVDRAAMRAIIYGRTAKQCV